MTSALKRAAGLAGAAGLVLLSGAAAPDTDFTRNTEIGAQCFHVRDVEGYSPAKIGEREGVNLRLKNRDVFQVEFNAPCEEAKTATNIKIQSNNVSDYVCSGAETTITVRSDLGATQQCHVSGLRKLSKDQISALPENEQP